MSSMLHNTDASPMDVSLFDDMYHNMVQPLFRNTLNSARGAETWFDKDSKSYEVRVELPGVSSDDVKLSADTSNAHRPVLILEVHKTRQATTNTARLADAPKPSAIEDREGRRVEGGRDHSPSTTASTTPRGEGSFSYYSKMDLSRRIVLPEDADYEKAKFVLKDGLFAATIPRRESSPTATTVPLKISNE